jgi:hypothetical protein
VFKFFNAWKKDRSRREYKVVDFIPDNNLCPDNVFNMFVPFKAQYIEPTSRVDTTLVMLNRDLANLVESHQNWDGGLDHHAQTMAMFLQYICLMVRTAVPRSAWVRLDYDSFATVPIEKLVTSLGRFLGWQTDWLTHPEDKHKVQKLFHVSSRNATNSMAAEDLVLIQSIIRDYTNAQKWKEHDDPTQFLLNRYPGTRHLM